MMPRHLGPSPKPTNRAPLLPHALSGDEGRLRVTEYAAAALLLACVALALRPAGDTATLGQCACAVLATALGIAADRSRSVAASAACELLASVSLLACASAAVAQVLLAGSSPAPVGHSGMACVVGAFALASALFGVSRGLHRLGTRVS